VYTNVLEDFDEQRIQTEAKLETMEREWQLSSKDLFIAKCVQIPQAEQKAASPEQLRLTSNRLPLPRIWACSACVMANQQHLNQEIELVGPQTAWKGITGLTLKQTRPQNQRNRGLNLNATNGILRIDIIDISVLSFVRTDQRCSWRVYNNHTYLKTAKPQGLIARNNMLYIFLYLLMLGKSILINCSMVRTSTPPFSWTTRLMTH